MQQQQHLFDDPSSGTAQVGRCEKDNNSVDFTAARDSEWHQLDHMQMCTSLQTDNYASTYYTPSLIAVNQQALSNNSSVNSTCWQWLACR